MTFLRFTTSNVDADSEVPGGLFTAAYALRDAVLPELMRSDLEQHLLWFKDNLAGPSRFNRSRSKGYYRRKTRGISWFRDTAVDHIARMRQLKRIVELNGYRVSVVKQEHVGYIVYEDAHQVVAEPFAETKVSG
jgi:hypothetical protein